MTCLINSQKPIKESLLIYLLGCIKIHRISSSAVLEITDSLNNLYLMSKT